MNGSDMSPRAIALAAIRACHGRALCRAAAVDIDRRGLAIHLAGAGKAAGQMAMGVTEGLGESVRSGMVFTKDGAFDGFAPPGVGIHHAGHPTPDARSDKAGRTLWTWLGKRRVDELVVFVLSGGASSLLATPAEGLTLADVAATTEALVGADMAIDDINRVRKQITLASAGRLARQCVARVDVLVLCDVVSGDVNQVGSGPFAPDATSPADALALVRDVAGVPKTVLRWLENPPPSSRPPAPDHPLFARVRHRLLATPMTLVEAAAHVAREAGGGEVLHLPLASGSVDDVAERLTHAASGLPSGSVIVSGGEPTLQLPAKPGAGGRNQHLALLMARAMRGRSMRFVALGSDGSDGPTDAAGAEVTGESWAAMTAVGDPDDSLAHANAYPLLDAAGLLIRTGPTGTNLCDLHILAVS